MMVQRASTTLQFNQAWTFPEAVEKHISTFIQKKKGLWLHAPVGISKIATGSFDPDVRIITLDRDPELKPDIVCDVFKMTENQTIREIMQERGGFDGIISDPIWYEKKQIKCKKCKKLITFKNVKGLAYHERRYLSYQLRDVLKPSGVLIFNALWSPTVKGLKIDRCEFINQRFTSFRNGSLLFWCRKINENL